jgi:hypothetical protein
VVVAGSTRCMLSFRVCSIVVVRVPSLAFPCYRGTVASPKRPSDEYTAGSKLNPRERLMHHPSG